MVRKVCLNCRCGKAEHNVVEEEDPGFFFVGKLFDRYLHKDIHKKKERKRNKTDTKERPAQEFLPAFF
jgi:hypothetical protein